MAVRLISSAVGIVILVVVMMLSDTFLLPAVLGMVIGIILFELVRAVKGEQFKLASAGVILYGFVLTFLRFYQHVYFYKDSIYESLKLAESILFPVCLLMVFIEYIWHHQDFKVEQLGFMTGAMYLVPWSITQLIDLKFTGIHGMFYLIMALCGAWIADSGAYFSGVALGKHKLCPTISPKKTVEGFVGGLLSNAVIFVIVFVVYTNVMKGKGYPMPDMDVITCLKIALLGVVCAGISVLGDLTASVIKREKGIKDYGNIMPGHGGLMDRFDSVLFVVPAFHAFVNLFTIL